MPPGPLPSGEGAPDYYERQFGDRIRQIRKGGARPPRDGGGGSSGGRIATGVIIAILFGVFRAAGCGRPTRQTYPPPAVPRVQVPNRLWQEALERVDANRLQPVLPPVILDPEVVAFQLDDEDVPLPEGLCYRIYQESRQAGPSPGNAVWNLLDESGRGLVRRAAIGGALNAGDENLLFTALNGQILASRRLYDPAAFAGVLRPGDENVRRLTGGLPLADRDLVRANRALLEAAYPAQIIPTGQAEQMGEKDRDQWVRRARDDLGQARRQFGRRP
jgi:hypothetical protein